MKKHLNKIKKIPKKIVGALSTKAGIFFLIIGILMTSFSAILIYSYVFSVEKFADFLPKDNLVALLDISELKIPENIQSKNSETQDSFNEFLSFYLGVDMSSSQNWRGDRSGMAIYSTKDAENKKFDWVVFFEIINQKEAADFLKSIAVDANQMQIEQIDNLSIINFPSRDLSCTFIEGYLACANKNTAFFSNYLEAKNDNELVLASSADYQRANTQLSQDAWIKLYFSPKGLLEIFSSKSDFIYPFFENIKIVNIAIEESQNSLNLNLFAIKEKPDPEFTKRALSQEKYKELAVLLPVDTIFFMQSRNSKESINYAFDQISVNDPTFKEFALLRLRAILANYFGDEISLENDILPLLSDDFLVGISGTSDNLTPFLILRTSDELFAEAKRKKLAAGFEHMADKFIPKIITHPLDDGDELKEVFPNNNAVKRADEDIAGGVITTITTNNSNNSTNVALGRKNKLLVVSSNMNVVKDIIQKIDLPDSRRDSSELFIDFPLKTFSEFDEIFGFSSEFIKFLPNQNFVKFIEDNLGFIEKVSGKIVRIPDSVRIEISAEY